MTEPKAKPEAESEVHAEAETKTVPEPGKTPRYEG